MPGVDTRDPLYIPVDPSQEPATVVNTGNTTIRWQDASKGGTISQSVSDGSITAGASRAFATSTFLLSATAGGQVTVTFAPSSGGNSPAAGLVETDLTTVVAARHGVAASNPDNTTALNGAFAAAAGGTCILPPGTLNFAGQVTSACNVKGAGRGATKLVQGTALGATTPAWIHAPAGQSYFTISDLTLQGPGTYSLGVKTATCWGLRLDNETYLKNVSVTFFDAGVVMNSPVGHIWGDDLVVANNYYGVYNILQNSDYYFKNCLVNGNTFANFATPADQGFASMVLENCHIGFAPYSFYIEATPASQGTNKSGLGDVQFLHCDFEAIGNAAIYSDATDTGGNFNISGDLVITHPGFSWNTNYKIGGRPYDYTIKLGHTTRNIMITDGPYPFLAAGTGIFYVNTAGHNAWVRVGSTAAAATDMTVGSGGANYYAGGMMLPEGYTQRIAALPTASALYRGLVFTVQGNGSTTADVTSICLLAAAGTYSWKTLATG